MLCCRRSHVGGNVYCRCWECFVLNQIYIQETFIIETFLLKYFVFSFSVDRDSRGINSFHDSDFRIPKSPKHQVAWMKFSCIFLDLLICFCFHIHVEHGNMLKENKVQGSWKRLALTWSHGLVEENPNLEITVVRFHMSTLFSNLKCEAVVILCNF